MSAWDIGSLWRNIHVYIASQDFYQVIGSESGAVKLLERHVEAKGKSEAEARLALQKLIDGICSEATTRVCMMLSADAEIKTPEQIADDVSAMINLRY